MKKFLSERSVKVSVLVFVLVSTGICVPEISSAINKSENPHSNIRMLTPWNHRDGTRHESSSVLRSVWELINYTSAHHGNIDRPVTSKVTPVLTDARASLQGKNLEAFALLEEYQLEYMPTPKRRNGKQYRFNKLFNFDEVTQWRVHHPDQFVETIEDNRAKTFTTDFNLAGYFCKNVDPEKGTLYFDPNQTGVDCLPERQRHKQETYSIFLDMTENGGLEFGSHISQLNYTKAGHVKSTGDFKVQFETGKYPDNKAAITFDLLNGLIDVSDKFVHETPLGEKYLRVRNPGKAGYGQTYYIPMLTAREIES